METIAIQAIMRKCRKDADPGLAKDRTDDAMLP